MGKKFTLKTIGQNITREVAKGVGQLAKAAENAGYGSDIVKPLTSAQNGLTAADFHGKPEVIKLKTEFGDIEKVINDQSAAIEKNTKEATEQTKAVLADCLKLEGENKDLESLDLSTNNADVKSQLDNKKRDEVIALSKAVTDIQPVKTANVQEVSDKNPVHLRGQISNAPDLSKDKKTGLENSEEAKKIADKALASLKTLATETKKAFDDSTAALAKLKPEIEALQKEISAKREAIQAALAAAKKEKEAAAARAKREAEEKDKKKADLAARMAALKAEMEELEQPKTAASVSSSASMSVSAASASAAPKPVTPALNAANDAKKSDSKKNSEKSGEDDYDLCDVQPGATASATAKK